jgi:hypothetical protein
MSCVNDGSVKGLVGSFLGSERTRSGGEYTMLAEENKRGGGGEFW